MPTTVAPAANVPVPAGLRVVHARSHSAVLVWNRFPFAGGADPAGVTGYEVRWDAGNGSGMHGRRVTSFAIAEVQPLPPATAVQVEVRAIGPLGARSAPARAVVRTATLGDDPSAATAERAGTTMFVDGFEQTAGALDPTRWRSSTTGCASPDAHTFVNDQFHAHTLVGAGECDAEVTTTATAPLRVDATDDTTITFELDGVADAGAWYLVLAQRTARSGVVSASAPSPANAVAIRIAASGGRVRIESSADGTSFSAVAASLPLAARRLPTVPNVRRDWRVTSGHDGLAVQIDGTTVVSTRTVRLSPGTWTLSLVDRARAHTRMMRHWDSVTYPTDAGSAARVTGAQGTGASAAHATMPPTAEAPQLTVTSGPPGADGRRDVAVRIDGRAALVATGHEPEVRAVSVLDAGGRAVCRWELGADTLAAGVLRCRTTATGTLHATATLA